MRQFQSYSAPVERFKRVTFFSRVQWGEAINFDPQQAVVGASLEMEHNITLRPHNNLNVEWLYLQSRLNHRQTGARFFNQEVIRNRTTYQLTPFNALRAIIDYDTAAPRICPFL